MRFDIETRALPCLAGALIATACATTPLAPPAARDCPAGLGDCDGDAANGCETKLASDPSHCRFCGQTCRGPGVAEATCVDGQCRIIDCAAGACDLDGLPSTGCEGKLCSTCGSSPDLLSPQGGGTCMRQCPPLPDDCYGAGDLTEPSAPALAERNAPWHVVGSTALARVAVERRLYRDPSDGFSIRVRVTNRSARDLGLELSRLSSAIYPNQWGSLNGAQRVMINERRRPPPPVDHARVLRAFQQGKLHRVPPGKHLDYWASFSGPQSDHAAVDGAGGSHLFVSLAGQQVVTDGQHVERVVLGTDATPQVTDLVLVRPVPWSTMAHRAALHL